MEKINQVSFSYYSLIILLLFSNYSLIILLLFSNYFASQSHYIIDQVPVPDGNRENTKVIYQDK